MAPLRFKIRVEIAQTNYQSLLRRVLSLDSQGYFLPVLRDMDFFEISLVLQWLGRGTLGSMFQFQQLGSFTCLTVLGHPVDFFFWSQHHLYTCPSESPVSSAISNIQFLVHSPCFFSNSCFRILSCKLFFLLLRLLLSSWLASSNTGLCISTSPKSSSDSWSLDPSSSMALESSSSSNSISCSKGIFMPLLPSIMKSFSSFLSVPKSSLKRSLLTEQKKGDCWISIGFLALGVSVKLISMVQRSLMVGHPSMVFLQVEYWSVDIQINNNVQIKTRIQTPTVIIICQEGWSMEKVVGKVI